GGTVLLTSHYLEEIEQLAQRVVVVGGGRVLADGDLDQVRGLVARSRVSFRAPERPALPGVTLAERDGDRHVLHTADPDRLVRELVHTGVPFSDLQVVPASLEEAFLNLTSAGTPPSGGADVPAGRATR
ncbi:MAG TPA: ABC transporter ATP-binding protein, partial [Pseudonocardia sp.]|nr:ABC transporter ATP-binding protein [Pseudonocardia sp.]